MNYEDMMMIEGEEDGDIYAAIQRAINAGHWSMQGSFGRTMMRAIEAGNCMLGKNRARDYYGNTIPSRDDVEPGTKGSYDYVVDARGEEYAAAMAAI